MLPKKSLSGYEVIRLLTGGLSGSTVSLARNESGKQVVIKADSCETLRREVFADCLTGDLGEASRMFPKIYDTGIADDDYESRAKKGQMFAVFELLGGVTLDNYLGGKLPPIKHALAVVFQLAYALRSLYNKYGIRHCDMHAKNVLVDPADRYTKADGRFAVKGTKKEVVFDLSGCPKVRIIDFGLAEVKRIPGHERFFGHFLLRLYQLYLRPADITSVRLKLKSSKMVSPSLMKYMKKGDPSVCRNHRSDVEAVLGMEDIVLQLYGLDDDAVVSSTRKTPLTYYQILLSKRFKELRASD